MKHYIHEKGCEFDAHVNYRRNKWSNEASLSRAKRGYRRRERAALRRVVEELVIEELATMKEER